MNKWIYIESISMQYVYTYKYICLRQFSPIERLRFLVLVLRVEQASQVVLGGERAWVGTPKKRKTG